MGRFNRNCFGCAWCILLITEIISQKLAEIREKVHRTSIYISTNLREEDKTRFKELADSQFNGDYSYTLRWLLDCAEGLFFKPDQELSAKIDLVADEVNKLKEVVNKLSTKPEEKTKIRMVSGKIIEK